MGRRVAEATKASRMRRTRGEIGRLRFRCAAVVGAGDFDEAADFLAADFAAAFAGDGDFCTGAGLGAEICGGEAGDEGLESCEGPASAEEMLPLRQQSRMTRPQMKTFRTTSVIFSRRASFSRRTFFTPSQSFTTTDACRSTLGSSLVDPEINAGSSHPSPKCRPRPGCG